MNLRSGCTKTSLPKWLERAKTLQSHHLPFEDHTSFEPTGRRKSILSRHLSLEEEERLLCPYSEYEAVAAPEPIPSWHQCNPTQKYHRDCSVPVYKPNKLLNQRVALFRGPVTMVKCDAIVNAANENCMGGGGVDGAVHRAAGPLLVIECAAFPICPTGSTRITKAYDLPARYILHSVGPIGENPEALASCYTSCLGLATQARVRSLAFCMISTGIFGYPLEDATHVALKVCREWLLKHPQQDLQLIFACYTEREQEVYERLMASYFPRER
eukprot:NODE_3164_length_1019_cov_21.297085_g3020_i0.p1 GENE.NODE_3164_length_1019_cov_21.297085_g3020_i0~~NODE_3164_length_1019_cov_21.297085_g3020_i0.p1  ORF type:complete len:271 (+),score=42.19 NODE_3164_length_1019_cov_21.297085_g3020_i0:70-882(+)